MKIISIAFFFIGFLLMQPYRISVSGLNYGGDDDSYLAHATSLAYFNFPNYSKEYFIDGNKLPKHSIGPAILAFPFVFSGSLIDRITGNTVIRKRTGLNLRNSWSSFGFIVSTVFFYWLSLMLLYKLARLFFNKKTATISVVALAIFQVAPIYVFRRPIFSHVYELFLQSTLLYLLVRMNYFKLQLNWQKTLLVSILISLIPLVRINNLFYSLAWFILFFKPFSLTFLKNNFKKVMACLCIILFFIGFFKIYPALYNNVPIVAYDQQSFFSQTTSQGIIFIFQRIAYIFFWYDWGLIFTTPFILIAFWGLFYKIPYRKTIILLLLPSLINLFFVVYWRTQGGFYAYRYLIFSLLPLCLIPLAFIVDKLTAKNKNYFIPFFLLAGFSLLPMLFFEVNSALRLHFVQQNFGASGWGNNTYQIEVWKTLFTSPLNSLAILLNGGPIYILYLFCNILNIPFPIHLIQNSFEPHYRIVLQNMAGFNLFLKSAILYLLPFVLYFFSKTKIAKFFHRKIVN